MPERPAEGWEEVAEAARGGGTVLVVGAADRGKSTFCRWLVGELARAGRRTGWLDGDVGQPCLGSPTTQSLALVGRPFDGLPVPEAAFFVGNTSPRGHMLPALVGLRRLRDLAQGRGVEIQVVDTTGLVAEEGGGGALKRWKIELLEPALVVALERDGELGHFLDPVRREGRFRVLTLAPAPPVRHRPPEEREDRRRALFREAFRGAQLLGLPASVPLHGGRRALPGQLLGLQGAGGFLLGLGVVEGVEDGGLRVLASVRDRSLVVSLAPGALGLDPWTGEELALHGAPQRKGDAKMGAAFAAIQQRTERDGGERRRAMKETRDAYVERLKAKLDEWNAAVDRMSARSREIKAESRAEYEHLLTELRTKRADAQEKLSRLGTSAEGAWEELRAGADKVWKELQESVERFRSRFP